MAPLRLSVLLGFFLGTLHVLAALGGGMTVSSVPDNVKKDKYIGGGYWYSEVQRSPSQLCADTAALKAAAKLGWETAQSEADRTTAPNKRWPAPVCAALCVPSHGIVVATSIKGPGLGRQSAQTCQVINIYHRNYGNCAEPNVVAIAMNEFGINNMPAGSKLAVYGNPDPHNPSPRYIKPCAESQDGYFGCTQWLQSLHTGIELVTRDLSDDRFSNVVTFTA